LLSAISHIPRYDFRHIHNPALVTGTLLNFNVL